MQEVPRQSDSLADAFTRRPALLFAILLVLGICCHRVVPHSAGLWLAASFVLLVLSAAIFKRRRFSTSALCAAIAAGSLGAAQLHAFYFPETHISHFAPEQPRLAWVELTIDQVPRVIHGGTSEPRPVRARQVAQAEVCRILTKAGWKEASGRVLLQTDVPNDDLAINQTVRAFGYLSQPRRAMNPGQFDWAGYYRDQRLLATLTCPGTENVRVLDSPGPSVLDRMRASTREALRKGFTEGQSLNHALLRALVLGDSDPELRDVQEEFMRTGTSHHLAISGMHVAMLGVVVFGVCRMFMVRPTVSAAVGLGFVILYATVVLPSPPVIRSVLLCIAFGVGVMARRSVDGVQLLAMTVAGMLMWSPLDLYQPGFQLSFVTVLGLMVFTGPVSAWVSEKTRDRHVEVAIRAKPPKGLRAVWYFYLRERVQMLWVAAVVAWTVSAPVVAVHFSQVTPLALVSSIVVGVPVFVALVLGFVKIGMTLIVPPSAGFVASLAEWPVIWMRNLVEWIGRLPGNEWLTPPPSGWVLVIVFALLTVPLLRCGAGRTRTCLRCCPALGVVLLLLPSLVGFGSSHRSAGLSVTLLSVGAGQCVVVRMPAGKTVLFDAGSSTITDVSRTVLRPYFKHEQVHSIDDIFVSHANYDHYGAVSEIVGSMDVPQVRVTPHFRGHAGASATARALLEALGSRSSELSAGQRVALDETTSLQVLWPPRDRALKANDSSLVLRLEHAGRSILFTGDIQSDGLRALLVEPGLLKSDVLFAPHHGSSEPETEKFIAAVDPLVVLSSNDGTLSQKQREFDRMMKDLPLFRTHESGAIHVRVTPEGAIEVGTFVGDRAVRWDAPPVR